MRVGKPILFFFLTIFSLTLIHGSASAQPIEAVIELEGPRSIERIADCGNGMVESGEQCDDGADNGTEMSICSEECKLDVTEEEFECLRQEYFDCLPEDELVREIEVELAPAEEIEETEPLELVEIDEPDRPRIHEECFEWAKEQCLEPEDDPLPEPEPDPEPPAITTEPAPFDLLEGSGCSLNATSHAGSMGYLWFVMGPALWVILRRRS